jgi:hypothetical protein
MYYSSAVSDRLQVPSTMRTCCLHFVLQSEDDWGTPALTTQTFEACVAQCTQDQACQFVQYDYTKQQGNCRLKVPGTNATT